MRFFSFIHIERSSDEWDDSLTKYQAYRFIEYAYKESVLINAGSSNLGLVVL